MKESCPEQLYAPTTPLLSGEGWGEGPSITSQGPWCGGGLARASCWCLF